VRSNRKSTSLAPTLHLSLFNIISRPQILYFSISD
jgi:hypothetical protein